MENGSLTVDDCVIEGDSTSPASHTLGLFNLGWP